MQHFSGDCNELMDALSRVIKRSDLGYSYRSQLFPSENILFNSLSSSPKLQKLIYPVMLAYSFLIKQGEFPNEDKIRTETVGSLMNILQQNKRSKTLQFLLNSALLEELGTQADQLDPTTPISDYPLLHATFSIMHAFNCTSNWKCSQINDSNTFNMITTWAQSTWPFCSLARALYSTKSTIIINNLQLITNEPIHPLKVSILYSSSFTKILIDEVNRLDFTERGIEALMSLCNLAEHPKTNVNKYEIVLPLTIIEQLANYNANIWLQPNTLSNFALIIANHPDIQESLCEDEKQKLPTFECE